MAGCTSSGAQPRYDAGTGAPSDAAGDAHGTVLVPQLILPRVADLLAERGFRPLTRADGTFVTRSAGIYLNELTKWVGARGS